MKTIKGITFYQDTDLKKPFNTVYSIEVEDKKLRAVNPYGGVFGMGEKSRLNKFSCHGARLSPDGNKFYYNTIVNGNKVYFHLPKRIH